MTNEPTKKCTLCHIEKPLSEFPKLLRNKDGHHSRCKMCINKVNRQWREDSKDVYLEMRKRHYQKNRESILIQKKRYSDSHKEEKSAYDKIYRKKNEVKRRRQIKEWEKNSPEHRLRTYYRRIFNHFIHGENLKTGEKLVGCSYDFYISYITSKFKDGMSWANHGTEWHIDHIIPLSAFDLSKEEE